MVTACSYHVARWLIGGASNHFTNEVCLAGCDHVSHTRDGVEHLADLLVPNSIFLDFGHRNLEDYLNAAVKEDFDFAVCRVTVPLVLACFLWDDATVTGHPMGKLVGNSRFVAVVGDNAC